MKPLYKSDRKSWLCRIQATTSRNMQICIWAHVEHFLSLPKGQFSYNWPVLNRSSLIVPTHKTKSISRSQRCKAKYILGNTWASEDMKFLFESTRYLTSEHIEWVRYRIEHEKRSSISPSNHVSTLISALGWESLERRRLNNQVCMFYKIYSGLVGITLPAEINPVTRVSRYPNCAPFQQLITLNDTYI